MDFLKSLNEAKLHGHQHFEGLDISVEVPAGGYRRGKNKKTGDEWAIKVPAHYGYIKGTHSPDGEHLDCYLRKNPKKGSKVYVVHQLTVDGSRFDEDKVMLGYSSKAEAIKAFKEVTFKPNVMYGGCTEFDMEHFQVIAFSASNSSAMLTNEKTFTEFKKKGLITKGIKSPIMVAKKISESLAEGLSEISEVLRKGDLEECLDWGGLNEGFPVETVLARAYGHYQNTPYMADMGELTEEEFKNRALHYIMETDALLTDVEDEIYEADEQDDGLDSDSADDDLDTADLDTVSEEIVQEETVVEGNNYVVVVHTQIMENIGSAENPSWATAGSKVILVQEGFATYGDARSVMAKVSAGEIPVELDEGSYVVGLDIIPTGEYRQFYESVEEDVVEEDTTEEVFFQQQVMEAHKLAGIKSVSYSERNTPTLHETKARLEALNAELFAALKEEELEEDNSGLSNGQKAEALRVSRATLKANPQADVYKVIRAVCVKLYGDSSMDQEVIDYANDEYGSLDQFEASVRAPETNPARVVKKTVDNR